MDANRETVALGATADGAIVFCDPGAPSVRIIAAGEAYDRELLRGLRDEFDLDDYDAQAAAREAAHEIPPLGRFIRKMQAAENQATEEA